MAKIKGDVVIDQEVCKGCGLCMEACPTKILAFSKEVNQKGYLYATKIEDNCTGCGSCATICPDVCFTVYRKKIN